MNHITHIAFLGPQGSYSHIACQKYATVHKLKKIVEHSCQNFFEILKLVQTQQVEYGILPIENSTSGPIYEVQNLLQNTHLYFTDEIKLPIKHCLLANNNTDFKQIQTIYSHPQAFQQCNQFLNNFSNWKIVFCKSSSDAMQIVSKNQCPGSAALGNKNSGTILYGLRVLKNNLTNNKHNITRFIILKYKNIINTNIISDDK